MHDDADRRKRPSIELSNIESVANCHSIKTMEKVQSRVSRIGMSDEAIPKQFEFNSHGTVRLSTTRDMEHTVIIMATSIISK